MQEYLKEKILTRNSLFFFFKGETLPIENSTIDLNISIINR